MAVFDGDFAALRPYASGVDLTGQEMKIFVLNTSGQAVLAGAAAGLGVIEYGQVVGKTSTVRIRGKGAVLCAGTIAAGASFTSNASGLAVAPTTGQTVVGYLEEAGVAGKVANCVIEPTQAP